MSRNTAAVLSLSLVLVLAAGLWIPRVEGFLQHNGTRPISSGTGMTQLYPPRPLTAFVLRDTHRKVFDLSRLRGHWNFLFFGYSHCTDVCPDTLDTFKQLHKLAGGMSQDVQYVFVSVDPQRDSADRLTKYLEHFDPDIIGATGTDDELVALTGQLSVYYKRQAPLPNGSYGVDHTSAIFLVDPKARLRAVFTDTTNARDIAKGFGTLRHEN